MRRVEADWRQYRHHFALVIILDPCGLRIGKIGALQKAYASVRQRRCNVVIEQAVLHRDQVMGFARDLFVDLLHRQLIGADGRRARVDFRLQAGNANLKKFVEVAADDAQEAQPLQQRCLLVFCLRQHTAVERELLNLAIQKQFWCEIWLKH